ncbi:WhiB family transcriptional regulator [Bailinhaonella thermotolerans]|uniref:WhiB family transcriptional regulator n=1 Tax=Bailinhaonella thermotolerans TaxID=1070861 RepID=UPI00192A1887|nr:WhiB family transcriptional regulator [Bailinhaonella thermotolerans]
MAAARDRDDVGVPLRRDQPPDRDHLPEVREVIPLLPARTGPAFPALALVWTLLAEAGECRHDPDLHAGPPAPETEHRRAARLEVAREVCRSCPVRALCLRYAQTVQPSSGMWAGRTADEIRQTTRGREVA